MALNKKGGLGKGLGKGIDSLISNAYVVETKKKDSAADKKEPETTVKLRLVEPASSQPRLKFDEDTLTELAESIKKYGVIQPIVVKKVEDHYQIIAGERRWRAAKQAGTPAIRTSSIRDVVAIKEESGLPVIGLIKIKYPGFESYITPTMKEVDELVEAVSDVIALDCTDMKRGDGKTIDQFITEVRAKYPDAILMADISTYEEGVRAWKLGMDIVGTTMSGYTSQSPKLDGPDYELVKRLSETVDIPVIGEGRVHSPEEAVKMLEAGAFAVVVGGAITRPLEIAARFINAVKNRG